MTRWKMEPTYTLILLHSHNRWSRYCSELEHAATQLGLLIGTRQYANHYDGSTDREWYVSADALARVGGIAAVQEQIRRNEAEERAKMAEEPAYFSDAAW